MAKRNKRRRPSPCSVCWADCETCQNSHENSIPVKLYTPKGAARAMLAGAVLKDCKGRVCKWNSEWDAFSFSERGGDFYLKDFSGLFEEF